jgi:hypothetical protein
MYFRPLGYVNYWHLSEYGKGFHTVVMRLPQSSSHFAPFPVVFVTLLSALAAMLPLQAQPGPKQLQASPPNLRYGVVTLGQSESQEVVLTNNGSTSLNITSIGVSGSAFTVTGLNLPVTLSPGQSVTANVSFNPSGDGWTSSQITIVSNATNPSLLVATEGTGVQSQSVTVSPSSVSFGQVVVGKTSSSTVVVTNPHSWNETLTGVQTTGSTFSVSGASFPVTLAGGQSVTLNLQFSPQATGADAGSAFLTGPGLNIPLSGTGSATTGQLSISPGSLNFGNVNVGSSTTQPSSMTASGGSVTISSASSSNSQFSISGISLPVTINAGQSVAFDVVFSPTQSGSDSSSLSFASTASNQANESLSGTGVNPSYSVNLSWNSSNSPVSGYNVYRGTAPGVYAKINSALDPVTAYTDSTVAAGVTYYYAATSVNSGGQESGYSSPVQVAVP